MCDIRIYDNEQQEIKDLICTNIMQRGVGNVNPMKMAKCIQELERIKGIKKGNNQFNSLEDNPPSSQEQLASELGISQKYLQEMKKLTTLIPELQTMIENGSMKGRKMNRVQSK
ncbi:hypothetical protein [Clostridium botulinum]|uniref:hypothetical protein n=1 Tax=Clostridium botulinum TaxID=1491 RepID=UPI001C9B51F7|nr:hypothetical protein [Clostridium botulinum]MBY6809006.1 hypothetical protein [Clostridium botulinum]MBY6822289.1 hypothetical protein [Clostridium botulinum]MBY6832921.1 hypothetical protein [Clostridium botulinum]MBY6972149.1 hypothetical protein [Clostridium botulinum]MCS6107945.1 hypothetical protein [Clostridium botulinum]